MFEVVIYKHQQKLANYFHQEYGLISKFRPAIVTNCYVYSFEHYLDAKDFIRFMKGNYV